MHNQKTIALAMLGTALALYDGESPPRQVATPKRQACRRCGRPTKHKKGYCSAYCCHRSKPNNKKTRRHLSQLLKSGKSAH